MLRRTKMRMTPFVSELFTYRTEWNVTPREGS
jgi:hypothetical protein